MIKLDIVREITRVLYAVLHFEEGRGYEYPVYTRYNNYGNW